MYEALNTSGKGVSIVGYMWRHLRYRGIYADRPVAYPGIPVA